ncbi:uncharacterized protein LY79DRAFT_183365 [Colletotrichum navitas]|uniref:Uncharacterized protein n=1 Tax=Colletotrichum navitas TaxID=681940 RepID=A0AAD8Q112_9PEZI|nr:uncharacterized protein LY79DRAFT_183365 [Colletotrichum navitas]KAK1593291.1 hypothetical protein LY79DRAFT_183365 [Colletotrichum navitas]
MQGQAVDGLSRHHRVCSDARNSLVSAGSSKQASIAVMPRWSGLNGGQRRRNGRMSDEVVGKHSGSARVLALRARRELAGDGGRFVLPLAVGKPGLVVFSPLDPNRRSGERRSQSRPGWCLTSKGGEGRGARQRMRDKRKKERRKEGEKEQPGGFGEQK